MSDHKGSHRLRLIFILGIALLTLIIGAVVGSRWHKNEKLRRELKKVMHRIVEENAHFADTLLKTETWFPEGSDLEMEALFELKEEKERPEPFLDSMSACYDRFVAYCQSSLTTCSQSIQKRNEYIAELRNAPPAVKYELRDKLIDFLNLENEFFRDEMAFYRRLLDLTSKTVAYQKHNYDVVMWFLLTSSYHKKEERLRIDAHEAAASVNESANDLCAKYRMVLEREISLADDMNSAGIVSPTVFRSYQEKAFQRYDKAKTLAEDVKSGRR